MILVNLKHLSSHLGGNCNERNINQFGVIAHVFEYPEEEKNSSHKKWSPAEEDLIRRQVELRRTQIHHMKDGHLFADTWWYIIRFKMRMESKHEYKNTSRLHMILLYVVHRVQIRCMEINKIWQATYTQITHTVLRFLSGAKW